ncbi:MAG: 4-(cytidine 5'-diphospho)-2-C-methyl-D-erythritol kinase [Planctomycetaceae bacterium]
MLFRHQTVGVAVDAPAKLNLFLKVVGRRSDGYHDLETLMVSVGLYDTVRAFDAPGEQLSLVCFDAARTLREPRRELPPADAGNLVLKAATLLAQHAGIRRGARLELTKRIPMAAGLAGGSSDAAATLVALNRLWGLRLPLVEMQRLGAALGSDVPFFLCNSAAAVCRGRGEIVEPLAVGRRLHFVVARPPTGLSTALVFQNCQPSRQSISVELLAREIGRGRLERMARSFHNTLQEPAERLNPEVTRLRRWFSRQPFAGHLMSGSGSSYFGLCRSRTQALQLASRLRAARLGDVFVAGCRP